MKYRFDSFVLDTQRYELSSGEHLVHVEPQVFDVLAYLVAHRDRVVAKAELLDEVWGSRFVTESTLTSRIKAARQAIGDDGRSQGVIQTVRGRGFRFVAPVRIDSAPAVASAEPETHGGPPRMTAALDALIGRDVEVTQLARLLHEVRLVTVVGPGGVGKTRCAIEAAIRAAGQLAVDVAFVDLAPVGEVADVAQAVADGCGLRLDAADSPIAALCTAMREEQKVLLIDNFEHLIPAAPVVARLLQAAPKVRVLVTSRERLYLSGEQVFPLSPLACEAAEGPAPAVQLFETVARRLDPGFALDKENEATVVDLCRAVDGLPLGVELVASQTRLMSPGQLHERFGDRLRLLAAGTSGAQDRQRTMRTTIDWSFHLLTEAERRFIARLATFRGGVDLDAVDQVCGPGLDLDALATVGALLDKSLLRRGLGADGGPRFSMLELVREQAFGMLEDAEDPAESVQTRGRHAAYHLEFAQHVEDRRWYELGDSWIASLKEHFVDLDVALAFDFSAGDPLRGARTVGALCGFWHRSWRLKAGAHWTRLAMEHADRLDLVDRGRLHLGAGYLNFWHGRVTQAREQWQMALAAFEAADHVRYRALAQVDIAGTWMRDRDRQRTAEAISLCEKGLQLSREVGELPLIAHAVNVLGELTRLDGDIERAWAANREGLRLTREIGDVHHQTIFEMNLSTLALQRGDHEQAHDYAQAAVRRADSLRSQGLLANALSTAAAPELACGQAERAARLLGAADACLDALGAARIPNDQPEYRRLVAALQAALGRDRLMGLESEGRRLTLAEAVTLALSTE
ncbi:winged helix-turn-helix domain-containing protein [Streptomyces sp. Lzd4kr]|nr:winged helix-turn-helix domain-containing protein [Streptomyces sp. Lzd4kr]